MNGQQNIKIFILLFYRVTEIIWPVHEAYLL